MSDASRTVGEGEPEGAPAAGVAEGSGVAWDESPPIACPACQRPVTEIKARFCASCGHRFASPSIEMMDDKAVAADPLVGRTLADRYRIEEVIGRGGMGVVYRVEHTRIGKAMAVKLLHGDLARDREIVRRFRREAEAVSKLDHANTVQIFDFGHSEGMTFLVMELLGGCDLGLILHQEGTIPFARAAHMLVQVCGSVQQAHDRGIVHRDLKPENIRVLDDRSTPDFVKVLDFGLAKLRESSDLAGASITRQGLLVGTPYYMAPEQIRGEASDHRGDVYALGCVLYKAIVGVPPFWASTPVGVLTKHITDEPVAPTVRSPRRDLPPEVDRIVLKAMAKDPAARYGSMAELRADLEAYLRSAGVAPPSSRRSLEALADDADTSGLALTQPLPMPKRPRAITKGPARAVVAATRDEVERFERRIRAQSVALWGAGVVAIAGSAAGAYYLWEHRPAAVEPPTTTEREPNGEPGQANVLVAGAPLTGHIGQRQDVGQGDLDVYELEVPADVEQISLRVSELPNIDLAVDVFAAGRSDALVVIDAMPLGGPESAPNLPLSAGHYLVRVHEVRGAGRHPIENVSDTYQISWQPEPRGEGDEREWNDAPSQAESVALGPTGAAERRAFIGWDGDVDTYCLDAISEPLATEVSAIPSLDLQLAVLIDGGETTLDEAPRGEPERHLIAGGAAPRRVCVRVSAVAAAQRADATAPYTIRFSSSHDAP